MKYVEPVVHVRLGTVDGQSYFDPKRRLNIFFTAEVKLEEAQKSWEKLCKGRRFLERVSSMVG